MAYRPVHSSGEGALKDLVQQIRQHVYLPDSTPFLVSLATVVANRLPGPSVSVLLVGQPSCGGNTILQLIEEAPGVRQLNSLSSQALISGTSLKERAKTATGGFLFSLDVDGATMLIPDLTRVLAQDKKVLADVMGMLRDVSDGKVIRPVGTDGGRELKWEGKVGVLGKCTDSYDRHQGDLAEFGDRFMLYRWPEIRGDRTNSRLAAEKALEGIGWDRRPIMEMASAHAQLAVEKLIDIARDGGKPIISAKERGRIVAIAEFAAMSRVSILWDWNKKQILHVQRAEYAARASLTLAKVYQALIGLGVERLRALDIVRTMGADSMPLLRSQVIQACIHATKPKNRKGLGKRGARISEIAATMGNGREGMVRLAVEELWVAGMLESVKGGEVGAGRGAGGGGAGGGGAWMNGTGRGVDGSGDAAQKNKGGRPPDLWRLSEQAMDMFEKGWM